MNVAVEANSWIIADAVRRCNEKTIQDLELMTSPSQRSPEEAIKQVLKEYGENLLTLGKN